MRSKLHSILILGLIALSVSTNENKSLEFLTESSSAKEGIDDLNYEVYSMVWSAKYYNPSEVKTFFFAVPSGFATTMKVDTKLNVINLQFPNAKNVPEFYKVVKEEAKKAEACSFNRIITFSEEYTKVDLNLNFEETTDYILSNIHVYQNSTTKSVQIKITQPKSKNPRALYVTFDLDKKIVPAENIDAFIDYINGRKPS